MEGDGDRRVALGGGDTAGVQAYGRLGHRLAELIRKNLRRAQDLSAARPPLTAACQIAARVMASLLQRACQPQRLLHSGPRALPQVRDLGTLLLTWLLISGSKSEAIVRPTPQVAPVLRPHQPRSARWARSPGSAGTAPPAAGRGAVAVRAMAGAAAGSDFPSLVSPEWLRDR